MTNESYLYVSYFAAALGGIAAALLTAALLRPAICQAFADAMAPLGRLLRRVLPPWLILAVLFAFMATSYMDCSHHSYEDVVRDRPHMEDVTRSQATGMLAFRSVSLLAYGLALTVALAASHRKQSEGSGESGSKEQ